jgi:hypothetical protein
MSPSLKDGEPCGHPGCLNHVTHPCEGCGRTAGRGRPWNEERRWTQEYTAAFFEESIAESQTRELADHYHDSVDEADILICGNSRGLPETSEQRRASYDNARRTREELYNCLRPLGLLPPNGQRLSEWPRNAHAGDAAIN